MKDQAVILVVDDQLQNIELLTAFLQPWGYEVLQASSGKEALRIIAGNPIDLILLDVMMPEMDGFEVVRWIRQDATHRLLPVILVTALRDAEDRVKGIEAGCDDFLSKPFDKTEILARIRSLLKAKAYNDLLKNYRDQLEAEVAMRTDELRCALERIKTASLETVYRLCIASEYRDEDTGAHIQRVSRYAAAIAARMGLDQSAVESILHAAPMHDLGKIGIPDNILMKPAKLDAAEFEIMKQHTVIGAKILEGSKAEYLSIGATIALCHHEKWDGGGYPKALKGKEIPVTARITAIADVFDALTSRRPYKEPLSLEKSIAVIREGRGSHFDPEAADAFLAIEDRVIAIRKELEDKPLGTNGGWAARRPASRRIGSEKECAGAGYGFRCRGFEPAEEPWENPDLSGPRLSSALSVQKLLIKPILP